MQSNPTPRYSARILNPESSGPVHLELTLKLHSYPRSDREPVKILVIGSKQSVSSIVVALHQLGFAEIFEWTDFLSAPNADGCGSFETKERFLHAGSFEATFLQRD